MNSTRFQVSGQIVDIVNSRIFKGTIEVDNGKIIIDIAHVNVLQGNLLWGGVGLNGTYIIRIDYIDNTNYELQRKADLEDL